MEQLMNDYLSSIELGDMQQYKNMAEVFPLFSSLNHGPEYLTLKESLALGVLAITEVSEGGSVPNLKAINKGDLPILLLDGRRTLPGQSRTGCSIPRSSSRNTLKRSSLFSCTEQGRWSYPVLPSSRIPM